jgi:hypothetical protein
MSARCALAAGLLGLAAPLAWAAGAAPANVGESIYRHGVLGSGAPLEGERAAGGVRTEGVEAACVHCHQRSGLGSAEGTLKIPPITGQYLFHAREGNGAEPALRYVEGVHGNRDPYTDATLARAIREGLDSGGRPLSELMPRFALDDSDMAALIEYLKKLDPRAVPGVSDTLLHFATIITPEADAVKRRGMLDVLEHYFADKNSVPLRPSPPMRTSGKTLYSKSMYVANRRWQLHVWELTGPAATWQAQLEQFLAREPVMAVLSGLGGSHWAPVHEFCEHEQIPCLFPNIEVPVLAPGDFYSLYFSKGVLLEAELIARAIAEPDGGGQPARAVRQIYRAGDSGEAAARTLSEALQRHGVAVHDEVLGAGQKGHGVAAALRGAASADALVLWLRPVDIAELGEAPAAPAAVFMSGLMGGLERSPLPPSWRGRMRLAYPFDLPERRVVRVDYPLGWFSIRRIPVVAEQLQVDTYLACGLLSEALNHMADTFVRDYLVERIYEILEHRILTGYYPRLTLGTGQTLGSKGGYLVRFAEPSGARVVADGDWTVP